MWNKSLAVAISAAVVFTGVTAVQAAGAEGGVVVALAQRTPEDKQQAGTPGRGVAKNRHPSRNPNT